MTKEAVVDDQDLGEELDETPAPPPKKTKRTPPKVTAPNGPAATVPPPAADAPPRAAPFQRSTQEDWNRARQRMDQPTDGLPPDPQLFGQTPDPHKFPGLGPHGPVPQDAYPQQPMAAYQSVTGPGAPWPPQGTAPAGPMQQRVAQGYPQHPQGYPQQHPQGYPPQGYAQEEPPARTVETSSVFGSVAAAQEERIAYDPKKLTKFFVEVHRETANVGEGEDADEYLGFLCRVEDSSDFLEKIADRCGGGVFKLVGTIQGKPWERVISIPGMSKKVINGKTEEPMTSSTTTTIPPYRGPGFGAPPFGAPPFGSPFGPGYGAPPFGSPFGQSPFGGPPPFGSPFGAPPWGRFPTPGQPWAPAPGMAPPWGASPAKDAEIDALKEALKEAQDAAAAEREERRVEREQAKAEADRREMQRVMDENNRRFETLIATMSQNKGGGAADFMLQFMTQNMQAEQQRMERERQEREARMRDERSFQQQTQTERQALMDREQQRRDSERQADLQRAQQQAEANEKFWQRMFEFSKGSQQKPKDMIELITALQAVNPKKDMTSEVAGMITLFGKLQDVVGGGGREKSSAEEIVDKVTDGITTIAEKWLDKKEEISPQQQAVMAHQQHMAMLQLQAMQAQGRQLSPQQHQWLMQQQAAQAHQIAMQGQAPQLPMAPGQAPVAPQAVAQAPAPPSRKPTEAEWGRLLEHVLTRYGNDAEPEEVVPELYALSARMGCSGAMEILGDANPGLIRLKLPKIRKGIPADMADLATNLTLFEQYLLKDEEGEEWLEDLLEGISEYEPEEEAPPPPPAAVPGQAPVTEQQIQAAMQGQLPSDPAEALRVIQASQQAVARYQQIVAQQQAANGQAPPGGFPGYPQPGLQQQAPQPGFPAQPGMPGQQAMLPNLPVVPQGFPCKIMRDRPAPAGYQCVLTQHGMAYQELDPRVALVDAQNAKWTPNAGAPREQPATDPAAPAAPPPAAPAGAAQGAIGQPVSLG